VAEARPRARGCQPLFRQYLCFSIDIGTHGGTLDERSLAVKVQRFKSVRTKNGWSLEGIQLKDLHLTSTLETTSRSQIAIELIREPSSIFTDEDLVTMQACYVWCTPRIFDRLHFKLRLVTHLSQHLARHILQCLLCQKELDNGHTIFLLLHPLPTPNC
jgi:hypothetical protein